MEKTLSVRLMLCIFVFAGLAVGADAFQLELGKAASTPKSVAVAPVGTPQENGSLLLSTVNGITPAPNDWHLIHLAPGEYDIQGQVLQLKPYLVLEGSGEICTTIVGSTGTKGVVSGATNTELRQLKVVNINDAGSAAALFYENTYQPTRIWRVTAEANGGSGDSYGLYAENASFELEFFRANVFGHETDNFGIYNADSAPVLKHIELRVGSYNGKGYGLYNDGSYVKVKDADIVVHSYTTAQSPSGNWTYGVFNHADSNTYIWDSHIEAYSISPAGHWAVLNSSTGGKVVIDHSHLRGSSRSLRNDNSKAYVALGGSKVVGWVQGAVDCAANYYETYFFYSDTCPVAP